MRPEQRDEVLDLLNRILEQELAGVVRYTHYSFMVFGHSRIPIVSWFRSQAAEALVHAQQAGELIAHLGAYRRWASGRCSTTRPTSPPCCASRCSRRRRRCNFTGSCSRSSKASR